MYPSLGVIRRYHNIHDYTGNRYIKPKRKRNFRKFAMLGKITRQPPNKRDQNKWDDNNGKQDVADQNDKINITDRSLPPKGRGFGRHVIGNIHRQERYGAADTNFNERLMQPTIAPLDSQYSPHQQHGGSAIDGSVDWWQKGQWPDVITQIPQIYTEQNRHHHRNRNGQDYNPLAIFPFNSFNHNQKSNRKSKIACLPQTGKSIIWASLPNLLHQQQLHFIDQSVYFFRMVHIVVTPDAPLRIDQYQR